MITVWTSNLIFVTAIEIARFFWFWPCYVTPQYGQASNFLGMDFMRHKKFIGKSTPTISDFKTPFTDAISFADRYADAYSHR